VDLHAKNSLRWDVQLLQGSLGPPGLQTCPRVDYDDTFKLVVKSATVCMMLSTATPPRCEWSIQQLDVKNAFLHETLSETIFSEPMGFVDLAQPNLICCLNKSLDRLK
jgi:hypothetical protein